VYSLASQNIKANEKEQQAAQSNPPSFSLTHTSSAANDFYRVLPEPRKALAVMKEELMVSSSQSQATILSFALSLLYFLFKKNVLQVCIFHFSFHFFVFSFFHNFPMPLTQIQVKNVEDQRRLDPFLSLCMECMDHQGDDIVMNAMKCVGFLCLFPLSSWRKQYALPHHTQAVLMAFL